MTSLVTAARYAVITLDTTTPASSATAALETAQTMVEEYLQRPLAAVSRTETVRFARNGRLYPASTPITAVNDDLVILDSQSVVGASPDSGPTWPGLDNPSYPVEATITYTGGYDATTLPRTIENHIAWLAYQLLHARALAGIPAGVTAAHVGDVGLTFAGPTGSASQLSTAAKDELRPWRRKFV